MSFLKNIFSRKHQPVKTIDEFWVWFQKNEREFYNIVKSRFNIEKGFFEKLSEKLAEIKEGFFYVTGMYDANTVELILTANGNPKNIAFVEELIAAAPGISGWKFTALKPAMKIDKVSIEMQGLKFNADNLFFYYNELPDYPDEIDICIVHNEMTNDNMRQIEIGVLIFMDNYLGELDFLNNIDNLKIVSKTEAQNELIPIIKLKDFLTWRQKEFVEKYDSVRYDTENDNYAIMEAKMENGNILLAVINTNLLDWDSKASHPWIGIFTIKYDGSQFNGMPGNSDFETLSNIETEMMQTLVDREGYLNIGRQTADNEKEIYFACKDFRLLSKVFYNTQQQYQNKYEITFDIFKDKYWKSFERFQQH